MLRLFLRFLHVREHVSVLDRDCSLGSEEIENIHQIRSERTLRKIISEHLS
jgi:hypothetical protein